MADIAMVSSALQGIKALTDIVEFLRQGNLSLEKAEVRMKLADLVTGLSDLKLQLADVRHLLMDRDEEIRTLKEALKTKGQMQWEEPYYFLVEGKKKSGPNCQKCRDADRKVIRLQNYQDGYWSCKVCQSEFQDNRYSSPRQTRADCDYDIFGS